MRWLSLPSTTFLFGNRLVEDAPVLATETTIASNGGRRFRQRFPPSIEGIGTEFLGWQ